MKNSIKIFLGVLAIGLIAAGYGIYAFNKKVPGLEKTAADFSLTANELFDAFESDESAAIAKFEGKVIEVSGQVLSVKTGNEQNNIIIAAESAFGGGVNCSLKDPVTGIEKGKTIRIKGRCQGYLMDVILNNCHVVED